MQEREVDRTTPHNSLEPDGTELPLLASPDASDSRLLSLAVGVVIVATLYVAREILVPIALAILLSFVLAPLVRLLRHSKLGRVPAVVLAVAVALGIVLSLGGLIGSQISQVVTEIPRYSITIETKIAGIRALALGTLSDSFGVMKKRIQRASSEPQPAVSDPARPAVAETPEAKPILVQLRQPDATAFEIGQQILLPIIAPLTTTGIVFIVTVFILLQLTDLRDRFVRLFGLQDQHRTTTAIDDAASRLSHYLLIQLGLNVGFGVIIGIGVLLIGIPNPLLWATLAGLFRFVPYIGSLAAGLLPTLFAAAVDPGWSMAIATAVLFLVGETIMGQFIDPLAYGRSTGLSPVSVVVAAIFWSWMWGPIGLILSMPLTVCLVVLGRHVPRLEFLEVMMGDQPALSPVKGFYQRILANDLDETQGHAETFLKDQPLSAYYDDVVINGLRLAAHDAERGVLTLRQLAQIQHAMTILLRELADHADSAPAADVAATDNPAAAPAMAQAPDEPISATGQPPTARPDMAPILCISGRGVLDRPVALMLTQLLGQQGMSARLVTYETLSQDTFASLHVTSVSMVCIISIELSGSPSYLRSLVRRVRRHLPKVPISVGLWPTDHLPPPEREGVRSTTGADYDITSLREAVTRATVTRLESVV